MWTPAGPGATAAWIAADSAQAAAQSEAAAAGAGAAAVDSRVLPSAALPPPPGAPGSRAAGSGRQWDALDLALSIDAVAAQAPAAAWQPGGGAGSAARMAVTQSEPARHAAVPSTPSALRCLDSEHPSGCDRCVAPPSREEEADYELCGDPGKKNGEKKLRALLCRTAEWADPDARLGVAAACAAHPDAEALATLGAVMSGRSTSAALRKSDLLHLTRCWGFKSDLWCRRNARKRAAPFLLDAPPAPLQPRRAEVKAAARAAAVAAAEQAAAKQAAAAAKASSRQHAAAAYGAAFGGGAPYGQHAASLYAQQQQQAATLQAQALHMFGYGGGSQGGLFGNPYGIGGVGQHIYSAQQQQQMQQQQQQQMQPPPRRAPPPQLQLPAGMAAAFSGMPVSPLGDIWGCGGWGTQQAAPPAPPPAPAPAPAAPAPAAAGASPAVLGSAAGLDAVSICTYIRSCLAPLATDAAAPFGGRDARDAALLFGACHVTPACAAQVAAAAGAAATTAAVWRARAADVAAQAAAVSAEGAAAVAWQCFLGAGFPMDRWLQELPDALHAEEAACPSRGSRVGDAPLTPAETAWTQELRRGRLAALELLNHLQSLVAQVKLSSLGTCLRVAAAAAEVVAAYTADVAAQLEVRGAWMRDLIASGAGGSDTAAPARSRPLFVWAALHRGAEAPKADDAAAAVKKVDSASEITKVDEAAAAVVNTVMAAEAAPADVAAEVGVAAAP